MAYDSDASKIVLFGGTHKNAVLNDSWTWDGTDWSEQFNRVSPSARIGPAMTYDVGHHRVVLFGGFTVDAGRTTELADTWTWPS